MDKLKCPICLQNLFCPKMCPHCSQVFCQICILDYLADKHFCPTCDNYIIDLVDCGRLVQQLEQVVLARKNNVVITNICKLHNLELIYFCKDCQKWICSDCGVIDLLHRGHLILSKAEVFFNNKQLFHKQLIKVIEKISKVSKKKQKYIHNLQQYQRQYKKIKKDIQKYFAQLLKKINKQYKQQLQQLQKKIKSYQTNLSILQKKQYDLIKIIQNQNLFGNKNHTENIQKQNKFLINNFNIDLFPCNPQQQPQQPFQQLQLLNTIPKITIIDQIFPPYTYFTYELNYQNLKQDAFHYSHFFEVWGQDWRLKIYPKGNPSVAGKYLSVFLQLNNVMGLIIKSHCLEKQHRYIYKIQLKNYNQAGSNNIVKEYCSDFGGGESWGYSNYLSLNHLNQYLYKGKLFFSIGIRNQSYQGLCCDLKKYIGKIQSQNKILQKLVCDSVGQISIAPSSKLSNGNSLSDIQSYSQIKMDQSQDVQVSIESS